MSGDRTETDVVIIDSGADRSHPGLKDAMIDGVGVLGQEGDFKVTENWNDVFGHGTAVCGIIHKHAPSARIFVIKIIEIPTQTIEEESLCFALTYILEHIECKLVNMSLGMDMLRDRGSMYELCCRLRARGTKLTAAFDNSGAVSYPAFFNTVWGVTSHDDCCNAETIGYCENQAVNLCAYGKAQRVFWRDGRYTISGGNSYACAHVSGIMVKALLENQDVDIEAYLREKAKFTLDFLESGTKDITPDIGKYGRAALYPFNKEMHSLIRFEEHLPFRITDVYDTKYSAKLNSSTNTILNIKGSENHIIANIENLNWEKIDTLILGHTQEMMDTLSERIPKTQEIIRQALQRGINVYSFDDYYDMFGENPLYFSPSLHNLNGFQILPFGKLYKFSKPVLGVFGTSSRQGKFTLQLCLRYILQERGYTLAQLGSEPTAYLYGMDACCHFGYGVRVDSSYALFAAYINNIMGRLDLMDRDLILVGCQSNTIPYELGNVNSFTFLQTAFLWGTSPDIVVLCVNPFDEIGYILQTVRFIEAAAECKVVAAVVFPSEFEDPNAGIYGTRMMLAEEGFFRLRKEIEMEVEIPVYRLGDEEQMNEMTDVILGYLS